MLILLTIPRNNTLFHSLASIKHLDCLGLSDNRLTAISIPTILENISYTTLLALDLSFNNLHDTGIIALSNYFKAKTVLQDMDLSHCNLVCSDIKILCGVLGFYHNKLEECRLSCNKIAEEGTNGECMESAIYLLASHWHHMKSVIFSCCCGHFSICAYPCN